MCLNKIMPLGIECYEFESLVIGSERNIRNMRCESCQALGVQPWVKMLKNEKDKNEIIA